MNQLQIFKNEEFGEVRTLIINDEPWFVGKDVAEILNYTNSRKAINDHVDEEDKGVTKCDTLGGIQNLTIINESGLYSLILSSKLPNAKKFKHWVTSEVLPSIRKTGGYVKDDELFINTYLPFADDMTKQLFKATLQTVRKQNEVIEKQKEEITEMKPKVNYYDIVLQCKDLITISVIAKDYGWSAIKMNNLLHENKVQYKQGKTWLLYQKYAEMGYTQSRTDKYPDAYGCEHVKVHTYWTQKGRLFIYELMKSKGFLPLIEQEQLNE